MISVYSTVCDLSHSGNVGYFMRSFVDSRMMQRQQLIWTAFSLQHNLRAILSTIIDYRERNDNVQQDKVPLNAVQRKR